jgi:hypothetical protein
MANPAAMAIKNFEVMGRIPTLSGIQKTSRDIHYRSCITSKNTRRVKGIGEQHDHGRQPLVLIRPARNRGFPAHWVKLSAVAELHLCRAGIPATPGALFLL